MEESIKKIFESGTFCSGTTIMITSNNRMKDKMKIIDSFEYSDLLLKDILQKIKKETREQRGGFLGMLLFTLGANLPNKDMIRGSNGVTRAGQDV